MSKSSEQFLDPRDPDELSARFIITVDKDGIMEYNCDWEPGSEGISHVASIFYKVMFDGLPDAILAEIKQQCVLNNKEEDYINLINIISSLAIENSDIINDDEVVVQPDQVFHL
jgi:hypothetical protein